jgi:hypothetical protein
MGCKNAKKKMVSLGIIAPMLLVFGVIRDKARERK